VTASRRFDSVVVMKKIGLVLGGAALIGLFLVWMLLKGTAEVRSWTEARDLAGPAALGLAWLCLLGGCALIVRAVYARPSNTDDVRD